MQLTSPLSGFLQEALVKKVQQEAQLELGFSNNGYLPPYKAPEKVKTNRKPWGLLLALRP
jgi:hypothetical protein